MNHVKVEGTLQGATPRNPFPLKKNVEENREKYYINEGKPEEAHSKMKFGKVVGVDEIILEMLKYTSSIKVSEKMH